MYKIISTLIIIGLLSGCANKQQLETTKIIDLERVKCPELEHFEGETMGDLYESYIELAKLYKQCSNLNDK